MAKLESTFKNMVLSLVIISMVAAGALAGVYMLTLGNIEAQKKAKQEAAKQAVLAGHEDGIAVETAVDGFGGTFRVMIGFDQEGNMVSGEAHQFTTDDKGNITEDPEGIAVTLTQHFDVNNTGLMVLKTSTGGYVKITTDDVGVGVGALVFLDFLGNGREKVTTRKKVVIGVNDRCVHNFNHYVILDRRE